MRKMRLREVKKIVRGPKLLNGGAEIPIWICLAPKSMLSLIHTQLDCNTFPVGMPVNLGAALIQKPLHIWFEQQLKTFLLGWPKSAFGFLLFFNKFILFIYFWLRWVFVAVRVLSLVGRVGSTLRCGARASHDRGFSCCGARALGTWASVVVAHRLSSCGAWV